MLFDKIYRQDELKQQLINIANSGKISHAQLFYNKEGGAALQFVLAYTQYIYCGNKQNNDSCGTCASCLKIQKMAHPDVHFSFPYILSESGSKRVTSDDFVSYWKELVAEKEGLISYNLWRDKGGIDTKKAAIGTSESEHISSKLALKSFEGGYKTLIMWLPEMMNESASNKLLKLIEEPPANTLFFFVTENPDRIIQTIRSRTQQLTIPQYKKDDISSLLQEKFNTSETLANSISNVCDGNLIEAFGLITGTQDNIYFDFFKQWMRLCYKKDISSIIDWVDDLASLGREDHKAFIAYALHFVRNALMTNYMGDKLVHLSGEELGFNQKFAPFINHNNAIAFYDELSNAYYNLERNASPKPLLLNLSIKVNYLIHKS